MLLVVEKLGSLSEEHDESRCTSMKDKLGEGCRKTEGQVAGSSMRGHWYSMTEKVNT